MTDQTTERGTGGLGETLRRRVLVLRLPHLHFDQLVVEQRGVDGLDHTSVEAPLPDLDHGLQAVRQRAELASMAGGQW